MTARRSLTFTAAGAVAAAVAGLPAPAGATEPLACVTEALTPEEVAAGVTSEITCYESVAESLEAIGDGWIAQDGYLNRWHETPQTREMVWEGRVQPFTMDDFATIYGTINGAIRGGGTGALISTFACIPFAAAAGVGYGACVYVGIGAGIVAGGIAGATISPNDSVVIGG